VSGVQTQENLVLQSILVTLPQIDYDPVLDNKQVNLKERNPIKVHSTPVATTFAIFDE